MLARLAELPANKMNASAGSDGLDESGDEGDDSTSRRAGEQAMLDTAASERNGTPSVGVEMAKHEELAPSAVNQGVALPSPPPPGDGAVVQATPLASPEPVVALRELDNLRKVLAHATTADECRMLVNALLAQWKVEPSDEQEPVFTPESRVTAWLLAGGDGPPSGVVGDSHSV
jgi:hypothetical protein